MRGSFKLLLFFAAFVGIPVTLYFFSPSGADALSPARDALARRDFPTARRELEAFLAFHPDHRDALFLAARTARRADDPEAAEAFLKRFEKAGGPAADATLERDLRKTQAGEVGNAVPLMRLCAEQPNDPSVPFVLEAFARGLLAVNNLPLAVECLDQWLGLDLPPGDRAQAFVWRGEALARQGLAPEAAAAYRRALQIDSGHTEARFRLADFLARDEPREALPLFESLNRDHPDRPDVWLGLARCHRQLGDLKAAASWIAELSPESTDEVPVLVEAGALALDRGRPKEAEPLLRKAVKLAPNRRDPNVQLLRCLEDLGDWKAIQRQRSLLQKIDDEIQRRIDAAKGKS
jgi:tetratricopeptide (TPR) repeat protein